MNLAHNTKDTGYELSFVKGIRETGWNGLHAGNDEKLEERPMKSELISMRISGTIEPHFLPTLFFSRLLLLPLWWILLLIVQIPCLTCGEQWLVQATF
jgi:hypothetical protein